MDKPFLDKVSIDNEIAFDKFVLDTRYTLNLIILVVGVSLIGFLVYILVSWLLKSQELKIFVKLIKKFQPVKISDQEIISTHQNETSL